MSRAYYILMIAVRILFDLYRITNFAKKIKNHFYFGTENLDFFVKKRTKKVFKSALKTDYYKQHFIKLNQSTKNLSVEDFPIIDKKTIIESQKSFCLKNIFIPKTMGNTGGSTGSPFSFFTDLNCRLTEFSHQLFFYKELGFNRFDKIYSFGGLKISHQKIKKNIFWKNKIFGFPFGNIIFSADLLTDSNASHYFNKISNNKPQFLRGYPSAIMTIANFIKKNKIRVDFLKGILLTSEMISIQNISLISKYFNCKVVPQYGQAENSVFGFAYPNKLKYFCSPFYGITEVINPKTGLHVKENELGEVVVTSLSNLYQPLIRYKTGDLAIYGGKKNDFVVLDKLYGREQDFIFDKNFNKILLVGLIFGSHTEAFNHINDWQFVQNKPGKLFINIHHAKSWNSLIHENLVNNLFINHELEIEIKYYLDFVKTKAGKRKFLIQNIKVE